MKTTINISDDLFFRAKERAKRDQTTLRAIVEGALRSSLREKKNSRVSIDLEEATFSGKGINPEFEESGWSSIRNLIYE